ncbi:MULTISPECIES: YtxH domain-containing protein [unclassified Streptococcus]|uniref:YtxH domain-containing protein n=1 Tax=unclassified Streptococcus TaxID=2608887 RepID=UPI001072AA8E|nr:MULTISPECIES: YtxH domain-containing protein [unclassified Streptococcus]MBF0788238.1 YtxH domain-containing protein [Streptococcus sp. 19428wC2_LYSM12]MCQ9212191.1 YtxH domain-containing protein [Streptococcus sp. B01]MCQ9213521.1 YtxH domain-containing protein [Streptococcus sp. O1]TFV04705.1 YtxH domain-containing protein [Streptococcus sp. LYSM12]
MVKKSSIFTSVLLGAAGGAAAAVFLATKTGQAVKQKVVNFAKDYQDNHEEINAELIQKAQDLGQQAVDRYESVKGQLESGELTVDHLVQSGKEKAQFVKSQSLEKFEQIKEKIAEQNVTTSDLVEAIKEKARAIPSAEVLAEEAAVTTEDIEIDLPGLEEE